LPFPNLTPQRLFNFWHMQLVLLGVAVAVWGMFWLLLWKADPTTVFLFTFIIGNCTSLVVFLADPHITKQEFQANDSLAGIRRSTYSA
jgi:uncharacterized membrane protein YjjP (DUF1212 family)